MVSALRFILFSLHLLPVALHFAAARMHLSSSGGGRKQSPAPTAGSQDEHSSTLRLRRRSVPVLVGNPVEIVGTPVETSRTSRTGADHATHEDPAGALTAPAPSQQGMCCCLPLSVRPDQQQMVQMVPGSQSGAGVPVEGPPLHPNHVAMLRRQEQRTMERRGEVLFQPKDVTHLYDANHLDFSGSSSSSFGNSDACGELVAQCCCLVCSSILKVGLAECMAKCCLPAVEAGCTLCCRAVTDPVEDRAIYYCGEECADCGKAVGQGCCCVAGCAAGCAACCWLAANGGISAGDVVNMGACAVLSPPGSLCAFH